MGPGVNLNDVLIPHLKKAFRLTDLQSSLIQTAFFGGYFLAALPAGRLMERIGYKKGILTGLLLCATGALLFIPAATILVYGFFLFALFVMACGQSFLEVAANPYVTELGPKESAERRLNLAQSFNSVGAVITPFVGAAFILTNTQSGSAQVNEASTVRIPYLIIAAIFLSVAAMIYFTHLPEVHEGQGEENLGDQRVKVSDAWKFRHLREGVLAQFFYVGAQVGVASFVIRLAGASAAGGRAGQDRRALPPVAFGGLHDRTLRRLLGDEVHSCAAPAPDFRRGVAGVRPRAAVVATGRSAGVCGSRHRILSLDYVSYDFCAEH